MVAIFRVGHHVTLAHGGSVVFGILREQLSLETKSGKSYEFPTLPGQERDTEEDDRYSSHAP